MNQKVSDETRESIIRDYKLGIKVSDLISKYSLSRATVDRILKPIKTAEKALIVVESHAIAVETIAESIGEEASVTLKEKLERAMDYLLTQSITAEVKSAEGAAKAGIAVAQFYQQAFPMGMKELAAYVMSRPNFDAVGFAQALRELYGKV